MKSCQYLLKRSWVAQNPILLETGGLTERSRDNPYTTFIQRCLELLVCFLVLCSCKAKWVFISALLKQFFMKTIKHDTTGAHISTREATILKFKRLAVLFTKRSNRF